MHDYTIYYKEQLEPDADWGGLQWDLFISAFNSSERVQRVFDKVKATKKHWLLQPEYHYNTNEYPAAGTVIAPMAWNEADFLLEYLAATGVIFKGKRLCLDITGFMRPHLLFFLYYLMREGVQGLDVLYSEPGHYAKKEKTIFSDGPVTDVRQVAGFEGFHVPDTSSDVLVIGSGYDLDLMRAIAEDKENARKLQLFGFPSLRPEMYQENVLQAARVSESIGRGPGAFPGNFFAPASDPFVTATVLSKVVDAEITAGLTNLYLCPTGTKAQALGFGLYYLREWQNRPCSIVFPFREGYARETTKGLSRVWKYAVEL